MLMADARPWDTRWYTPLLAQLLADAVSLPAWARPAARSPAIAADARERERRPIRRSEMQNWWAGLRRRRGLREPWSRSRRACFGGATALTEGRWIWIIARWCIGWCVSSSRSGRPRRLVCPSTFGPQVIGHTTRLETLACIVGCSGQVYAVEHYLVCLPLRLVIGLHVASYDPTSSTQKIHGLAPAERDDSARGKTETWAAVRRCALASSVYHALRAHRHEHGPPTAHLMSCTETSVVRLHV